MAFSINGNFYDFYDDPAFSVPLLNATADVEFPRTDRRAVIRAAWQGFLKARSVWWPGLRWLARTLWSAKADLWVARGRVHKLSFVIHNFMDACRLERDRLHACVFMVASPDGPISMCLHNAKRDEYVLRPVELKDAAGTQLWNPITGDKTGIAARQEPAPTFHTFPIKFLKGRARAQALQERQ
jgi:hypothetical protein